MTVAARRSGFVWRCAVRGQGGFAPLSLALGVAFIIFPVLSLVVTIPTWLARSVAARDAAAAAAAAMAGASSWAAGTTAADRLVAQTAVNDAIGASQIAVSYAGSLNPGATVTATVTVTIPAGVIPGVGSYGAVHYSASSTEHVDTYKAAGA